ncbi:MAG: SDR family NAD(P)-dependent oxidoreductase, partial [Paracoccaceae bacterium]
MSRLAALTGATGFVGGHVAAALAARGWRLRVLARRTPRLDLGATPLEVVAGDLADAAALEALAEGADAVIHVAGAVRARRRADFMAVNRDGAAALAAAVARRAPGARAVLVSSLAARAPEISDYAASKAAGEAAFAEACPDAVVLRPGAGFGPGDRATLAVVRA